jgi:uncharacterized membrane protein YjjP (DUF1212 family)
MEQGSSRISLTSVTAAVVLLGIAIATMVSWYADDWYLFLPIFLVMIGVYIMAVGLSHHTSPTDRYRFTSGSYIMFWGSLLALIGLVVLLNHNYPGNGIWLFLIIILWLALSALLFTMRPRVAKR